MSTLILPTTPIAPTTVNPRLLLLYGPPKIGKTTLLSELKDNLIVDTENGTNYVEALKLKVNNYGELEELCDTLIAKGKPYKYVSFDTVDGIESWCEKKAYVNYKKTVQGRNFTGNSILDLEFGAGQRWLRDQFHEILAKMCKVADNIILTAHVRDKYLNNAKALDGSKLTGEVSSKDLDLTGKVRNILCSIADAIGYVYRNKEGQFMINFKTTEDVNCGCRSKHLIGKEMEFKWESIYLPEPREINYESKA